MPGHPFVMIHIMYIFVMYIFQPFLPFVFLKFISVIFINIYSLLALLQYIGYNLLPLNLIFWLINVYYNLFYIHKFKINALFCFKGMQPYFKVMHFHLSFNHFLIISHILDLDSDDSPDSSRSVWPVILFRVSSGILQVSMTWGVIKI